MEEVGEEVEVVEQEQQLELKQELGESPHYYQEGVEETRATGPALLLSAT